MMVRGISERCDAEELQFQFEIGPVTGQSGRPKRAGERSAHPSAHPSGEFDGNSAATTGVDVNSAKAIEGSTPARGCFKCGEKGHRVANCAVKLQKMQRTGTHC